jgi:FkbH-like protein
MFASQSDSAEMPTLAELKELLKAKDEAFSVALRRRTGAASSFGEILELITLRKRAVRQGLYPAAGLTLRLAIVGGASLRPLADLIEHFLITQLAADVELWLGDYDNYVAEIMEEDSPLYAFRPDLIFLLPADRRCVFAGDLKAPPQKQQDEAARFAMDLLGLADMAHQRSKAEVILANFRLPPYFDVGPLRTSLVSEYGFKKYVNFELGFRASANVQICDVEFLANRMGTLRASDERLWFESKQPGSPELMVEIAREVAALSMNATRPAKKVIVLDLDNTLWGGVIGDDGLDGIELGTTSPRGEAFRDFQRAILEVAGRGVLLAVCSKNDYAAAIEPFVKHPEMMIRLADIAVFKSNWEPKFINIREIANDLNLGLDSLVFFDDNPAEISIVRQFAPEVTSICLGEDPASFTSILRDCRLFEQRAITDEDLDRVKLYRVENLRRKSQLMAPDMNSYLVSLKMRATIRPFNQADNPRISQLINKSNQFNLTTRRRTVGEVTDVMQDRRFRHFTVRLGDRFGEHGLIAVVIGEKRDRDFWVDTWLMSCRVLKRKIEELTLNKIVECARLAACDRVIGVYGPTAKNGMVADLYPSLGFVAAGTRDESFLYELNVNSYAPAIAPIDIVETEYADG